MNTGSTHPATVIVIGIGATLLMDLWNLFLKRAFGLPSLNFCLLGRWIGHMAKGQYRHLNISRSPEVYLECTLGWASHYSIGITLTLGLYALTSGNWFRQPNLFHAVLYGIVTAVFPLFIMQPAFGLGIASAKTPKPAQARLKSLGTHCIFGFGLYLCAKALMHVRP